MALSMPSIASWRNNQEWSPMPNEQTHKRQTILGGWIIFLVTFLVYAITASPTVAFWDCGEYVASMESLGIPHPPGNPLFIMMGRVFSLLFFFLQDVGFRINLGVALLSALSIVFIYLIIVRVMVAVVGTPENRSQRITVFLAAYVGALFAAFGYTFWFSAVEQSECNPSMLVVVLSTWIIIKWAQCREANRDRYLVLFTYVAYLGIGIHMMAMLALMPAFLFVVIVDKEKLRDWRFWITCLLMSTVIFDVSHFLWIAPAAVAVTLVFSLMKNRSTQKWRLCFWIAFFAFLGYTAQLYIPIRSALNPAIDENHPVVTLSSSGVTWGAFKGFLERKQYGSESMFSRMFWRRGSLSKQFGIDGHMGYGGFHITQFFHFGNSIDTDRVRPVIQNYGHLGGFIRMLVYLLPTVFMMWGWVSLYSRNRPLALLLILLFIGTTIGLVLYMNFSDGYHCEKRDFMAWVQHGKQGPQPTVHREVRIRDYFFTPGFMFLGMWLGIAAGCLLHGLFSSKSRVLRTTLAPILCVLLAISPALPFTQNLGESSRAGDWIPFDYAYNLLMSCERNGILFTNGDNDTFPLWALQEGYGIRRDVRIINLSLANTKWYIKQLKNLEPIVPITYTERQIDALTYEANPIAQPMAYTMPNAGITITLPGRKERNALKVQDKMVLNIVDANAWRKPIYFAVTVSGDNYMGLRPYLQMHGLAFRVMRQRVPEDRGIDADRTIFLLEKVFRFRGLGKGTVLMNETSKKLLSNYAAAYLQAVYKLNEPLLALKRELDSLKTEPPTDLFSEKTRQYDNGIDRITTLMDQCISLMPGDSRPRLLRQDILIAHDLREQALAGIRQAREFEPDNPEYIESEALALAQNQKIPQALALLGGLDNGTNDMWLSYMNITRLLQDARQYDDAITVLRAYLAAHPNDHRATAIIGQFETLKKAVAGDTTLSGRATTRG
jgi:hypothetical protein